MATEIQVATREDELTDAGYDLADKIEAGFKAQPDATWTPSGMARKVKADTGEVRNVLAWMVRHRYIDGDGNGAWTRYMRRI